MLSDKAFEHKYEMQITLHGVIERVSLERASENLFSQYKRLKGESARFEKLLENWDITFNNPAIGKLINQGE